MAENELALRKLLADSLSEGREPLFADSLLAADDIEVFIVDLCAVEVIVEDELGQPVRGSDWVRTQRRREVLVAERGYDNTDPCGCIFGLLCCTLVRGETSV